MMRLNLIADMALNESSIAVHDQILLSDFIS